MRTLRFFLFTIILIFGIVGCGSGSGEGDVDDILNYSPTIDNSITITKSRPFDYGNPSHPHGGMSQIA